MKATFPGKDAQGVLQSIRQALTGRKLGEISTLKLSGATLTVTISKVGTSVLTFTLAPSGADTLAELTGEKLALAHRPFRGEVQDKVFRLVERAGGIVTQRK